MMIEQPNAIIGAGDVIRDRPSRPAAGAEQQAALRLPPWLAPALLAALMLAAGALCMYETRGTTFFQDEWSWILGRRGSSLGTFLSPHNEHLSLVPVIVYKLLFATAGLRHYWPYRAVVIGAHLLCGVLVFAYARRRVGGYLAVIAAALILFFGPGWQDFLWPFQMAWLFAIDAGVGTLLLLDRRDRAGEVGACVLLAVALASAGPGIAFAIGAVVEVLGRRRPRDLWIVFVPIALYALWWLGYQHTSLVSNSVLLAPRFVFDAAAGVLSALAGLAQIDVATDTGTFLSTGPALLAASVAAIGWRLRRSGRIPLRVATLVATALAFWTITALGRANAQVGGVILAFTGDEGRYLYVGAVIVVLIAVEVARGVPVRPPVAAVVCIVALAAIVSNLGTLRDAGALLRGQAQVTETEIGTLDITRTTVSPGFASNGFIFFAYLTAGRYFAAEHALGTPAASAAEIEAFPDSTRMAADAQLIRIDQPRLLPASAAPRGGCVTASAAVELTVPERGLVLSARGGPATVSIRRFSSQFQQLGSLAPATPMTLTIRPDLAAVPWHVKLEPTGSLLACSLG